MLSSTKSKAAPPTGSGTTPTSPPCAASTDTSGTQMNLAYNFVDASGHNNGNVVSITNNVFTPRSQSFAYDALNRLKTAQTTATFATNAANCWAETYSYDAWGNLLKLGADTANQSAYIGCTQESGFDYTNFTGTNNRITTSGYAYDAAGNLTTSPGAGTVTFNAENQMISAGGLVYAYDGDGKRVTKAPSTTPTQPNLIYWYGGGSDPLQESDGAGSMKFRHYYFNGQRLARMEWPSGWVDHYSLDHLGNARFVYGLNGASDVSDFYPFGGERPIVATEGNKYKFTGKERDSETGNDHFPAREYSSTMGRWIRPDPLPWIDWQHGNEDDQKKFENFLLNPQNFNMYSYVGNNPLNMTDPTGMKGCQAGDKKFETCTITIVYDPKTSKGTITVTGQNKGDKDPTVLLTGGVVVGGDGHVTPTGTFTAKSWEKDHVSTKYGSWANTKWSDSVIGKNVFGPYQLHIQELDKQGIFIHGTLGPSWSPTTWGNTVVGSTSHGCVRLCNQDDIALHNLMPNPQGNQIIIRTTPKPTSDDDQ